MTAYTLGLASGFALTWAMVLWAAGIGALIGMILASMFSHGWDRCADEDCTRRV